MKAILSFFKDLLFISSADKGSIGLSQFKYATAPSQPVKATRAKSNNLTDLMRKGE